MSKKINKGASVNTLAEQLTNAIAVIDQPVEVVAEVAAEPQRNPNLAPKFTTLGARDEMGFGNESETSWLIRSILAGTYTRATLQVAFLAQFVPTADASEIKRKKVSFSVFFSDVKRPIGTYHASRNLPILIAEGTGVLSFDATQYSTVKAAIAGNILTQLKGISTKKHPKKHAEVLASHNLKGE